MSLEIPRLRSSTGVRVANEESGCWIEAKLSEPSVLQLLERYAVDPETDRDVQKKILNVALKHRDVNIEGITALKT